MLAAPLINCPSQESAQQRALVAPASPPSAFKDTWLTLLVEQHCVHSRAPSIGPSSQGTRSVPEVDRLDSSNPNPQDFCICQTHGKAEIATSVCHTLPISKFHSGYLTLVLPLSHSKCAQLLLQQVLAADGQDVSLCQSSSYSSQEMGKSTNSPSTGS